MISKLESDLGKNGFICCNNFNFNKYLESDLYSILKNPFVDAFLKKKITKAMDVNKEKEEFKQMSE